MCVSSKASGGTARLTGASGAADALLVTLLATLDEVALDEAALETADEEAADEALDEATEEATEDAVEEALLLTAAGLYEHQVEFVGAPGKVSSAQRNAPVMTL
ncbi:hypothetical protein GCM10025770_23230 [Viridibacterium curvum]|uniref:Uncharacterized protein n=1 Tax=Viridibacterium curvum TaxID=1101404 RepID=A0ABP9QRY9_9RHOO